MAIDYVRINGLQLSWTDVESKIDGDYFHGYSAISFGDKLEKENAWGAGKSGAPRGQSKGKYSTDPIKVSLWKGSGNLLRARLSQKSYTGKSYGDILFYWSISFVNPHEGPQFVELFECRWLVDTSSHDESAAPLKDEAEFSCQWIKRNGRTLFDNWDGLR